MFTTIACIYYATTVGILLSTAWFMLPKFRCFIRRCKWKIYKMWLKFIEVQNLTKYNAPLSIVSQQRLKMLKRKTLILDMDETMMTSIIHKLNDSRSDIQSNVMQPDYEFTLEAPPLAVHIYKRPYLDIFLNLVTQWYDVVVYTTATENYAAPTLDYLDGDKRILRQRMFRQHCINMNGVQIKSVRRVTTELDSVLLIDNSDLECRNNAGNCVQIASFRVGANDQSLLYLIPFLDCLRFISDVRSLLNRHKKFPPLIQQND